MQVVTKKLETSGERLEAERLIATSFLHPWDEGRAKAEAEAEADANCGEAWGAFDEDGRMVSAVTTLRHDLAFEGEVISCGELHMVGTLPEARGGGAVRALMSAILGDYRSRGDLFATLIPFSFSFYRKFGFESASELLVQKAGIDQFSSFCQEFKAEQIMSQEGVDAARWLYEDFARNYNLADLKTARDWQYRGGGEFGERDWQHGDKTHYSYLFRDSNGTPRAYFTFVFVHGQEGPFTGTMKVTELIFDSPEALRSVFGFFYGMRAKITDVSVALPRNVDLSLMLPECDEVERKLDGHVMARVLNVERVLCALRHPVGSGRYSICVSDGFLDDNAGTYIVEFRDGKVDTMLRGDGSADVDMTVETFCQLAIGLIDLPAALYRSGTELHANLDVLENVFVKKPVLLGQ